MRHYLILFIFLLSLNLYGQDKKIDFSAFGGWSNSSLHGKDKGLLASDAKMKDLSHFFIGFGVDNPINESWGLKHEVLFKIHGSKFKRTLEGTELNAKLEMKSLQINPVLLSYNFKKIQIYTGPYISSLLSSSITALDSEGNKYKDHSIFGTTEDEQESGNYLQKLDSGWLIGLSYEFDFGLQIGASYQHGFTRIFDNSHSFHVYEGGTSNVKLYNKNLQIYVGYKL